ncbi:hypothetical protein ACFSR9_12080 [Deinococcus taklimakanensis]|uniref:Uncharacterized protein n=1 Tax=Deinococcus taklimakanensis TaxID=536443 RepID=A0ABW5P5I7_9DEIO
MKAKVTGVSAWQGTPTGGTLDIKVPRYADSHGNATVSHYTGILKAGADGKLRWMDAEDPTKELWIVVQGPDDPAGPRATFYEVLDYGDKTVRTEFSRKLISSDLDGLIFDYAASDQPLVPAGFGDAPLTMKAAEQLLDEGNQLVAEQKQALADTAQNIARQNERLAALRLPPWAVVRNEPDFVELAELRENALAPMTVTLPSTGLRIPIVEVELA